MLIYHSWYFKHIEYPAEINMLSNRPCCIWFHQKWFERSEIIWSSNYNVLQTLKHPIIQMMVSSSGVQRSTKPMPYHMLLSNRPQTCASWQIPLSLHPWHVVGTCCAWYWSISVWIIVQNIFHARQLMPRLDEAKPLVDNRRGIPQVRQLLNIINMWA